jgi:hypothetical protein
MAPLALQEQLAQPVLKALKAQEVMMAKLVQRVLED